MEDISLIVKYITVLVGIGICIGVGVGLSAGVIWLVGDTYRRVLEAFQSWICGSK